MKRDPEQEAAAIAAKIDACLAGGTVLRHVPARSGGVVFLGDGRAVMAYIAKGRLRLRVFAPADEEVEFYSLPDEGRSER